MLCVKRDVLWGDSVGRQRRLKGLACALAPPRPRGMEGKFWTLSTWAGAPGWLEHRAGGALVPALAGGGVQTLSERPSGSDGCGVSILQERG